MGSVLNVLQSLQKVQNVMCDVSLALYLLYYLI